MSSHSTRPPRNSTKTFQKWTDHLRTDVKAKRAVKSKRSRDLSLPGAHKVFVLTARQLIDGEGLARARFVAWKHFGLGKNSRHLVSAEIAVSGKTHSVARMDEGRYTSKIIQAMLRTINDNKRTSRKYRTVCLVKIPPLIGLAIWLRGRKRKDDLVFPVESCVAGVKKGKAYLLPKIEPLLRQSALALAEQSRSLLSRDNILQPPQQM